MDRPPPQPSSNGCRRDGAALVAEGIDMLAGEDRDAWSVPGLRQRLTELAACTHDLEAELVRATVAWLARDGWTVDAATSATAWLRHHLSLSPGAASRLVRVARLCGHHDRLAKLLATGDLRVDHLDVLARVATPERAALFTEHVDVLADAALTMTPTDLAVVARRWAHLADDRLNRGAPNEAHERRGVRLAPVGEHHHAIDGLLTNDVAALLASAFDKLAPPDPTDGPLPPRTPAQRRADALADMAHAALADRDGRIDPAHTINLIVDHDLLEPTGEADDADQVSPTSTADPRRVATHRCDLLGGSGPEPVPPATIRRLACTSWLSMVVTGADGEILHLGRRVRLFTPAQRRAIAIRDQHCVFPGCDRGPRWCDTHHLQPWETGGTTDTPVGVLLCRHHHTAVHDRGWALHRQHDGTWAAQPP